MRRRRSPLLVVAAALLAVLAGCTSGGTDGSTGPGDAGGDAERSGVGGAPLPAPLPDLVLDGFADGSEVQLADLRGPLVINVWATWCGPCREEMPVLEEFHQAHQDRVGLIGIDYQDPRSEEAEAFVAETGVTYPLYSDVDGEIDRRGPFPHLRGLPFLAFVDEQGQVVGREFVIIDDVAELEGLVEKHLDEELT